MTSDNSPRENIDVSITGEGQDGSSSHRSKDGLHRSLGSISRRQFLGITAGSIVYTGSVSAQEHEFTEEDAEEYWRQVTTQLGFGNWGYEATELDKYHEMFPDERGEGTNITVIDTGFDTNHPLYNEVNTEEDHRNYHVNVEYRNCFGYDDWSSLRPCSGIDDDATMYHDTKYHGTYVTGVVWQAAPNATYSIIRLANRSRSGFPTTKPDEEAIKAAIEETNPDVIVTATGWKHPSDRDALVQADTDELISAYNDAAEEAVVVAFAGNSGDGYIHPGVPSIADNVISVSSTKSQWSSSQSGHTHGGIDDSASPEETAQSLPEGDRNKPDVAAPGENIDTIAHSDNIDESSRDWRTYLKTVSGSSYAAPYVAGIAALLSKYGNPDEVRDAIYNSAIPLDLEEDEEGLEGRGGVSIMSAAAKLRDDIEDEEPDTEDDESNDDGEESSITIQLIDAETAEAIPDGTVTLHRNHLGHSWGPETTNEDGIVVFEDITAFPSSDRIPPERAEVASLQANAAGYEEAQQSLSWHPSDGPLDLTVELEADERDIERSVLTVNVVGVSAADYPEIPSVTVERNGETVAKERVDSNNQVQFSLEDGQEYTVSADGVQGERTVVVEGDTEITLSDE